MKLNRFSALTFSKKNDMTEEEIRKLAQSYVDELFAHDDMSDQDNIEDKDDALVMCMAFVGHILEGHCIVEKEKVKTEYDFWYQRLPKMCRLADKVNNDPDTSRMWGKIEVLNDIFGKSLFEEEK